MKRFLSIFTLVVGLMLVLSSCSSQRYNTTRIQNLDFKQYRTYAWLPPVDSLSKNYFTNDIARHNILSTANEQLEKLGLTYTKDNPDILFRYVTIVNNKRRIIYSSPFWGGAWGMGMMGWGPWGMWGGPWGWGGGFHQPVGEEAYRYSHLIIEAIDREKNTVVWQARGSGEVRNPERAINRLPKVVEGIFKKYPLNQ